MATGAPGAPGAGADYVSFTHMNMREGIDSTIRDGLNEIAFATRNHPIVEESPHDEYDFYGALEAQGHVSPRSLDRAIGALDVIKSALDASLPRRTRWVPAWAEALSVSNSSTEELRGITVVGFFKGVTAKAGNRDGHGQPGELMLVTTHQKGTHLSVAKTPPSLVVPGRRPSGKKQADTIVISGFAIEF